MRPPSKFTKEVKLAGVELRPGESLGWLAANSTINLTDGLSRWV